MESCGSFMETNKGDVGRFSGGGGKKSPKRGKGGGIYYNCSNAWQASSLDVKYPENLAYGTQ